MENFVDKIASEYGTRDPFEIARRCGVSVVRESWYPVTIGEFERRTKTIRLNLQALENSGNAAALEKKIVAHELGHFFAGDLKLEKAEEENFCHEFARILAGEENNFSPEMGAKEI